MPQIIDVVVVVDTEGLLKAYPNGIAQHQSGDPATLERYFKVLVDNEHVDPSNKMGIICDVNDTIYFRAIAKADNTQGVIILEFADKNTGLADSSLLTDYVSIPAFRTSRKSGFSYDNGSFAVPYEVWNGWRMWYAKTKGPADVLDPHMSVQALKSTSGLNPGYIQYTLGFRVTYLDSMIRDYWFDPTIKIR